MQSRSETFYLDISAPGMDTVCQQYDYDGTIKIDPKRRSGEPKVPHAPL